MIKIVVVDDSETIREGLETLINGTEKYTCVGTFSKYSSMVKELNKLGPDVLLIDLNLPREDSIEGIKEAKLLLPELRILVLTIYEENEHIFDALCAGACGYLVKKSSSIKLIQGIDDALLGGTRMSSSVALRVIKYFDQKKNRTFFGENELLTPYEKEILNMLMDGNNHKAIADSLELSIETVQSNFKNIYQKLHFLSKSEIVE